MHEIFNTEINYIKNGDIKESLITILDRLPNYFYEAPASSTGKYHPEFTLGPMGLVRHTKAVARIAYELFNNESLQNFTNHEKDLLYFSIIIHDGLKSGKTKSEYTVGEHPLLISAFVKENKDDLKLSEKDIEFICSCVETHMGPWTTNYRGEEILEAPKTKYQRFVHMCDYLASRKFLNIKFENNEIQI